ncbi:putative ovarian cancer-associated 2 protein [Tupanvirus deep ocean]|uniref:Ovarian cancer-associated 2 protein n=2 Tax=Tupanvirus TaxID=2094720 RepID=A0AC62A9W9_9VIRU|nr:putative ovarian cancer-associated 2 protein [Tupanvirus deep ocean]QKU34582.1 putative ovarian cancer-associated 2 protein [Tupanvirus deep ocean]
MSLNIICLHGFTQNSFILQKKLMKLVKSIKGLNFYFLDGCAELPKTDENDSRAYWVYDKEKPLDVDWSNHYKEDTKIYYLDESFEAFLGLAKKLGRIDGIIGFSQGGCFTDYICKMHAKGMVPFDLKFAVFIAAEHFNRPGCELNDIKPNIQTLHIYGTNDTVIPQHMSELLTNSYPNKDVFIHNGAHIIPSTSAAKAAFKSFISRMI